MARNNKGGAAHDELFKSTERMPVTFDDFSYTALA